MSTAELVYKEMKDQILHLAIEPGTMLSEPEVAKQYGVSRTPVRTVFKTLEGEGLLEVRPKIGTFVSRIDLEAISDILYMRTLLEVATASELAEKDNSAQQIPIEIILHKQRELIDSDADEEAKSRGFVKLDNEFHKALFRLNGRESIYNMFTDGFLQYERFRSFANINNAESLETLYEQHCELWNYILKGSMSELKELITHHINDGFVKCMNKVYEYPDYFIL